MTCFFTCLAALAAGAAVLTLDPSASCVGAINVGCTVGFALIAVSSAIDERRP